MLIDFTKMHGLGNDFMVVDNLAGDITFNAEQISNLANRHFGIGFDQLLVVETSNTKDIDFRYVIYNADGSEAEQCGNGARCFARFVSEKGLSNNNPIVVETRSGIISLHLNDSNTVRVDMGKPNLQYEDSIIPKQEKPKKEYQTLREKHKGIVLSVGNPHYVMIKKDIWNIDVKGIAEDIQNSGFFPDGINVGFMQMENFRDIIQLRVYERSVGETLSCGSGACAAVIQGVRMGLLDAKVRVDFKQGDVQVEYKKDGHVFLSGPAQFVFEGKVEI